MIMTRAYETKGRKLIFLLVLLSHCVLIFMISRSNTAQNSATQILHEPPVVYFLDSIKAGWLPERFGHAPQGPAAGTSGVSLRSNGASARRSM
jgi:hypothetical protein